MNCQTTSYISYISTNVSLQMQLLQSWYYVSISRRSRTVTRRTLIFWNFVPCLEPFGYLT